mgnify:CR=1 FL=1
MIRIKDIKIKENLSDEQVFLKVISKNKIKPEEGQKGYELLEQAAKRRGFLISGGGPDLERMANVLLDEYRGGKLGRITLEAPPQPEG